MLIDCWYSDDAGACASAASHLVLPMIVLGTVPLAVVARMTRSAMLEVLDEDYIRTARAKGLSAPRVVVVHALRNALIPVVTVIGLQVGALLSGAILTETIFAWPGVGHWLVEIGAAARLPGGAGRRAADRHPGDAGQSRRRSDLRVPQSQDPPLMSEAAIAAPAAAPMPGRLRLFWRSFAENRGAVLGLAVMVVLLLLAVFADVVAPHSPIAAVPRPFPHAADVAAGRHVGISARHRRCRARRAGAADLRRAAVAADRHRGGDAVAVPAASCWG